MDRGDRDARRQAEGDRTYRPRSADDHTKRRRAGRHDTGERQRTRPRRSLTPEEARRLFDWLGADGHGEHLSPMLRFGLLTGLRPGELFGMLWDNVDLERCLLVDCHAVRMEGNRAVVVPMLKTSSSYRTLGLPTLAVQELRRHKVRQSEQRLAATSWGEANAWCSRHEPARCCTPATSNSELHKGCVAAEVPEITPHELRHTAASLMVDDGQALESRTTLGAARHGCSSPRTATECALRLMPRSKPWTMCSGGSIRSTEC